MKELLSSVTTTQSSQTVTSNKRPVTFQATINGSGTVTATVLIYGSNYNSNTGGVLLSTLSLSGTASDVKGYESLAGWPYYYAVLSAVTGTGSAVTVSASV